MALREQIIFHAKVATDWQIRMLQEKYWDGELADTKDAELFRQLRHDYFGRYTKQRLTDLDDSSWLLIKRDLRFLQDKRRELWQ